MNHSARYPGASPDPQEEKQDEAIATIRAEIQKLQKRKRTLASSLLSAHSIQKLIRKPPPALTSINNELSPLVRAAGKHSECNHYRIAFGATAFPFQDPSPTANDNLLGVRLDVCARNGQFAKPYYVLLRRERVRGGNEKRLRVHRHTVPAFISMSKLEGAFLPFPGSGKERVEESEEGENLKPWKGQERKQDLRGFVRELRRELVAWHMRTDAVDFLREKLGLETGSLSSSSERALPVEGTGVMSLASTAVEARYVRLEWEDGRVGRFKLSNTGLVERAVVIGDAGRDKQTEDTMTGGGGRIEALLDRLRERGQSTA
ncbi:hypothetical protein N7448_010666 [Penicillium atrosanguineum]|uniref:Cenp-O kinetochore centromere component n=1 Tax=Penicillium atrosanguineum TaxID=1132637 RepID=A0A9W9GHU4_9EURO|nr:thioredoxin [Penicillium atrosanguineum]KAJ5119997.1 hypothetical protein N7448_010666 [Penicillium atrosanguineum]KAJ5296994.1 thioredoxin [Penicillium atrosanguineum]KAJ5299754.1 hypothetical protein N7476_011311 [Penicillium atrosanguineum]